MDLRGSFTRSQLHLLHITTHPVPQAYSGDSSCLKNPCSSSGRWALSPSSEIPRHFPWTFYKVGNRMIDRKTDTTKGHKVLRPRATRQMHGSGDSAVSRVPWPTSPYQDTKLLLTLGPQGPGSCLFPLQPSTAILNPAN